MIVAHYSEVEWDKQRWHDFEPHEVSCRHCGEMYYDEDDYDAIQFLRTTVNKGVVLNSAHRCSIHNAREGGKPGSMHKKNAFDIPHRGHVLGSLLYAARLAGFTGFGYYGSFLHVDRGRPRFWVVGSGAETWKQLLS